MIKFIRNFIKLLVVTGVMVSSLSMVSADAYHAFSIKPQIPDNQVQGSSGFFDLRVSKDHKQTIEVIVYNDGDEPMKASAKLYNASTGDNATELYNVESNESYYPSIKSIAKLRQESIVIPARTSSTLYIDLNVGAQDLEGYVIGSIDVTADTITDREEEDELPAVGITNRISYLVPIRLRSNDQPLEHNINHLYSKLRTDDKMSQFIVGLQNDTNDHMGNIQLEGTIMNGDQVIATLSTKEGGIFPKTSFDAVFTSEINKIDPGEYQVDITVTGNQREWNFKDTIIVDSTEAVEYNQINKVEAPAYVKWLITIIGSLVILVLLLLLLLLKRKTKEETE